MQSTIYRTHLAMDSLLILLILQCVVVGVIAFEPGGLSRWTAYSQVNLLGPFAVILATGIPMWLFSLNRKSGQRSAHLQLILLMIFSLIQGSASAMIFAHGIAVLPTSLHAPLIIAEFGLLIIATILLNPIPQAVLLFWLPMVVGYASFPGDRLSIGLAILMTLIATIALGSTAQHSHVMVYRWMKNAAAALKASVLLSEFEENRRGWFWETDARGGITYISPQLAAAISRPVADILGRPLIDLVIHENDDNQAERTLGFHLSTKLAFSEIAVRAAGVMDMRWWSLSGRPAFDAEGTFLGFRGSGTDLTEMRRSEDEVKKLASYDALTGLPNRILMKRTLDESMVDSNGRTKQAALFLIDLDRFKSVNDTLGHPVGDMLLRQVAQRLQHVIADDGQVGRLGGDEFKVVLPNLVDHDRLARLAEAIIHHLSESYLIEGSTVSIGASIGIARAPEDGATADALVRNADLALYAAKADGKGVHRFYEPEMHASAKERRLLEMDLRNVMSEGGLHLAYQPVVDAVTETIVGFEALARWNHPTRGPVSPGAFIPIAEEIGLIAQIGEWVLRSACMEASNWPDHVRVAVNISPIQFANPALPGIVLSALAASQLPAGRLELEITEGVFMNDGAATDAMFARLKAIGVRFALDDFGTGYSSLGYLKKAPFDKIKIDQSFVRGAAVPGNRNAAIIRAIVTLAESLEMETTAEGAETTDELELIRSLGCSHIQGYIFGKPMLSDEARARVAGAGRLSMPNLLITRDQRVAVLRAVTIRFDKGQAQGRVRNLSRSGAMVETVKPMVPGEKVILEFSDGLRQTGMVRWSQEGRFGLAFDEAIDIEQLSPQRMLKTG